MYTTPDGRTFMRFESIELLLDALRANSYASTPEARVRSGYVFRGHANSRWFLEPTIRRKVRSPQDVEGRARYTNAFVRDLQAARSELNVPGDDRLSLLAIAQHYGFPTSLLDFTYNFEVAAAFA